jgi:transglutaminase-like putative cysteine protease
MLYTVHHQTEYIYSTSVTLSQQVLHLTPRQTPHQLCDNHRLNIDPMPAEHLKDQDFFGNTTDYFAIFNPHQKLNVTSAFSVSLESRLSLSNLQDSLAWEQVKSRIKSSPYNQNDAVIYLYGSPHVKCSSALAQFALVSFTPGRPLIEATFDLTQRIYQEFEFDAEATEVSTPLEQVLLDKRGVCQDFAHLMIGCLRSLGLSCRYVSGYILTNPPEGAQRLIGADASHAWVSVYCPTYGWVDFDPTNSCIVNNEHITVAWGRDFSDISPMHGIALGGGEQTLKVSVTVTPEALIGA